MIMLRRRGAEHLLRTGLIGLAGVSLVGTALELAMLRHWKKPAQWIPWLVLLAMAAAILMLVRDPSPTKLRRVRLIALLAGLTSMFGVVMHVAANYEAAPLDQEYGPRWEAMSTPARWWAASTGAVGPSPPLVPGVLAQAGIMLALATTGHPASEPEEEEAVRSAVRGGIPTSPGPAARWQ